MHTIVLVVITDWNLHPFSLSTPSFPLHYPCQTSAASAWYSPGHEGPSRVSTGYALYPARSTVHMSQEGQRRLLVPQHLYPKRRTGQEHPSHTNPPPSPFVALQLVWIPFSWIILCVLCVLLSQQVGIRLAEVSSQLLLEVSVVAVEKSTGHILTYSAMLLQCSQQAQPYNSSHLF